MKSTTSADTATGGTVVFVSPTAGWVNAAEQAAALRSDGWRVVLACSAPAGDWERFLITLGRLIYHEIWTGMTGTDTGVEADDSMQDRILGPDVIDVRAFDYLGVQLARRKWQTGRGPRLGLPEPEWYDKRVMADRLVELGIPGPRVWDSPVADTFPVVVKTRITSAGKGVWICRDQAELESAWHKAGGSDAGAFVQEAIQGTAFSTAGVALNGELVAHETYVLKKPPWDPTGPSIQQEAVNRPDLVQQVRTFIHGVGFSGAFSLQQLEDESGRGLPYDFNPRSPGTWTALRIAGSGLAAAYDSLLAGRRPEPIDPLPPGTRSTTLMITGENFESREQLKSWLRRTSTEIKQRRRDFGWRFSLWAHTIRAKEYARAVNQVRTRAGVA